MVPASPRASLGGGAAEPWQERRPCSPADCPAPGGRGEMLRARPESLWQPTPRQGILARAVPALKANATKVKGRRREAAWEG